MKLLASFFFVLNKTRTEYIYLYIHTEGEQKTYDT